MDEINARISEVLKPTPATEAVAGTFVGRARDALNVIGLGALEFLASYPDLSILELTKLLASESNCGLSAMGLTMALYQEAAEKRTVRDLAKDLLTREIREEFSEGWSSQGTIRPVVRIGNIINYLQEPGITYASRIIRDLAIDHPPKEGWKCEAQDDPVIAELFDRYWPTV